MFVYSNINITSILTKKLCPNVLFSNIVKLICKKCFAKFLAHCAMKNFCIFSQSISFTICLWQTESDHIILREHCQAYEPTSKPKSWCFRLHLSPSPTGVGKSLCHLAEVCLEPTSNLAPRGFTQIQVHKVCVLDLIQTTSSEFISLWLQKCNDRSLLKSWTRTNTQTLWGIDPFNRQAYLL